MVKYKHKKALKKGRLCQRLSLIKLSCDKLHVQQSAMNLHRILETTIVKNISFFSGRQRRSFNVSKGRWVVVFSWNHFMGLWVR